jgi:Fur family ferric uptake transcriptional regulator
MQQGSSQDQPKDKRAEDFRAVIETHGGRWTRERLAILQVIREIRGHFFAEEVERKLHERGHQISLTTVYRNLPLLVEAGIIRRACVSEEKKGGGSSYEHIWGEEHHDHLICAHCGLRIEFSYPAIDVLQEAVAQSYGFKLERHHLELIGCCTECQQRGCRER